MRVHALRDEAPAPGGGPVQDRTLPELWHRDAPRGIRASPARVGTKEGSLGLNAAVDTVPDSRRKAMSEVQGVGRLEQFAAVATSR